MRRTSYISMSRWWWLRFVLARPTSLYDFYIASSLEKNIIVIDMAH